VEKLIISAPFGNWLHFPHTTPTLGTFTTAYRGGLAYRLWRCFLTLRYSRKAGGWVNRLGLPNPGIDSLKIPDDGRHRIVSIKGTSFCNWTNLLQGVTRAVSWKMDKVAVELNLSCPNVRHKPDVSEVKWLIEVALHSGYTVIAKLPPVKWMKWADSLYRLGVRHFHCCNTIPVPGGGLSGKALKQYSLSAVEDLKYEWDDAVTVIGGGGVTHEQDARDYLSAGADHVAVASVLLNPFNWGRIKRLAEALAKDGRREVPEAEDRPGRLRVLREEEG